MLKKALTFLCIFLCITVGGLFFLITQPVMRVPDKTIPPPVDPLVLERDVRTFSEAFHPRCYDHTENLDAAADYIAERFEKAGGRVVIQSFPKDELEYKNITAAFGPEGGPVLIVGAHYDSYGENYYEPPLYTPGADDNASGVAGLLALADLLGERPPAKRVLLAAYCLEEPPFFRTQDMGSAHHAAAVHAAEEAVIGMISLEMLGYFSDEEGTQQYPSGVMELVYPSKGNFIGVVGRFQDMALTRRVKTAMAAVSNLPVHSMNAPPLVMGIDFSDHRNYWIYGYEAIMITNTAFYRNHAYHTDRDTADRLDYPRMAKVVQGVFAAVMDLTGTWQ